jgi:mannosyltransferase OCH1-like enzyme
MSIPNITHQIWIQGWDVIPDKFKLNIESLKNHNPEFTHMTWDEKSLREECAKISDKVQEKFDSLKYIVQKADLGRYVILYNYGGVYADIDMFSLKPNSTTPNFKTKDFIISYATYPSNKLGFINNGIILSKKNNPLLMEIIMKIVNTNINENYCLFHVFYIFLSTGPFILLPVIYSNLNNISILDHKYYEPCFIHDTFCKISKEAIMDHRHELSWQTNFSKLFSKYFSIIIYTILYYLLPLFTIFYVIYFLYTILISSAPTQYQGLYPEILRDVLQKT